MAVVGQLTTVVLRPARPNKGRRTYVIYDDLKAARLEPAAAHVSILGIYFISFFVVMYCQSHLTLTDLVLMYMMQRLSLGLLLALHSIYIAM